MVERGRRFYIAWRKHLLDQEKLGAKLPVPNEFDVSVDLLHRMFIILCKVACDANEARSGPIYFLSLIRPKLLHDQPLELFLMVQEPVQVE